MGLRMEKWDCQGTAICRFSSTAIEMLEVNILASILHGPWEDREQRAGAGQRSFSSQLDEYIPSAPEICSSCSNAVTSVFRRGPKSHVSTEEIRAIATVFQRDARTTLGSYCGFPLYPPCLG